MRRPLAPVLTACALAAGALATCTPPAPVPPPGTGPVASLAPVTVSAAVSASAAPTSSAATLRASLTPAERAQVAVLEALCEPVVDEDEGARRVRRFGCLACPTSDSAGRSLRWVEPGETLLAPYSSLRGSFSAPGADEQAVFFSTCSCHGCEDQVILLRRSADGQVKRVGTGLVLGAHDCQVLRRAGQRDRAVCRLDFGRGYLSHQLYVYDLSAVTPKGDESLEPRLEFIALNDFELACHGVGAGFDNRAIRSWGLRDVDHDGNDDLEVTITVADGTITRAMLDECTAEQEVSVDDQGNPLPTRPRPPPAQHPKVRELTLRWLSTERGLVPDPATARLLAQLDAAHKRAHPVTP